jgi:Ice-binding-like
LNSLARLSSQLVALLSFCVVLSTAACHHSGSHSTPEVVAPAPKAPSLGSAQSFGVLGGSGVANTGFTTISGDVGSSPGGVTGFPDGTNTGTMHSADAVALQAQVDLILADNSLTNQKCGVDLTGQNLGGRTLTSDIYCYSSSATLDGDLVLDAQGNSDAVFIFQIGDALTTATGSSVVVTNGGSNGGVFWQVGSSATLGEDTKFAGTILALTDITLENGARVSGKLLALNGVVTLDTNNVMTPPSSESGAPDLGSAQNFAVLAGSTVSNVPGLGTTINGDLGVSPGTAVTGFPPGIVNGTIHAGDPVAAQAINDLTTAFNDAAARSVDKVTVAGNLGGQTLAPGLYTSGSSLEVTSGDLTLDAQGDANGVFIFQMGSTLTTTSGRQVILSGGAKAANVFWQVGTSATLGTTTIFKGNILADQSITVNDGTVLEGRALTRIGAVSLSPCTITMPTP